jgi:predicted site-specific integrase-resolvase
MTAPGRLVRSAEAARALGVTTTTLWRWRRAGVVRPATITHGGQARWNLEELRRQLAAAKDGAAAPEPTTAEPGHAS